MSCIFYNINQDSPVNYKAKSKLKSDFGNHSEQIVHSPTKTEQRLRAKYIILWWFTTTISNNPL